MNSENMLKVADAIADLPYYEKLDTWGKPKSFNMASDCGSSCCIGGWTGEVFGGGYVPLARAKYVLGLNQAQASALFKPPEYGRMQCDGSTGAQVLRLMVTAGDNVTGKQIRAFWRHPWA